MKVTGGCHCGALAYEAEVDPAFVGICHCTDCQILTGSAFTVFARVASDKFRMTAGKPQVYVKTGESGNRRAQAFCGHCGTRLYASEEFNPQAYNVRVGTIRERAQLKPVMQLWCRSALPWTQDLARVERFDKQP